MIKLGAMMLTGFWLICSTALAGPTPPDWKSWDMFPKGSAAPRYTADQIQKLLLSGEKMVLIYAGYRTDTVICGSMYLPYRWVPPVGSGAQVNLNVPKDTWMVAYCP